VTLGDAPAPPRPTDVLPVPRERLLHDWAEAHERARRYLSGFDLPEDEQERLAARAMERALTAPPWPPGASACGETMRALRHLLIETEDRAPDASDGAAAFLAWRLRRLLGRAAATGTPPTMPPVTRASMWGIARRTHDERHHCAPALERRALRGRLLPVEHVDERRDF
jgi:hypothetical protein